MQDFSNMPPGSLSSRLWSHFLRTKGASGCISTISGLPKKNWDGRGILSFTWLKKLIQNGHNLSCGDTGGATFPSICRSFKWLAYSNKSLFDQYTWNICTYGKNHYQHLNLPFMSLQVQQSTCVYKQCSLQRHIWTIEAAPDLPNFIARLMSFWSRQSVIAISKGRALGEDFKSGCRLAHLSILSESKMVCLAAFSRVVLQFILLSVDVYCTWL